MFAKSYNDLMENCYGTLDGKNKPKVLTHPSTVKRSSMFIQPGQPPLFERPHLPYTMDICPWFVNQWADEEFPVLTRDLVDFVRSPEGRQKLDAINERAIRTQTPIGLLKTMGSTMLHEVCG